MAMFIAKKDQYVGLVCHVEGSEDAVTPFLAEAIPKNSVFQRGRIEAGDRHRHRTKDRPALVHGFLPLLCGYRIGYDSGAVGYIGWNGNMDTAIAIRTAVIADGELHIQAGAGIVADSVPAQEWQETMNKGRAIFRAVAMAVAGLDPAALED